MSIETTTGVSVELPATPAHALEPTPQPTETAAPGVAAEPRIEQTGATGPCGRDDTLARAILWAVSRALPPGSGLTASMDGASASGAGTSAVGPGDAASSLAASRRAHVRVHGPAALARMLPPTENAFADAYLRGDVDIDGDIALAIAAARGIDVRRLSPADIRRVARWSLELRLARRDDPGVALARPAARLTGPRHSRARDLAAIRFHYDVGEAFYRLWLDRRLTYSCAYFERDDDPVRDLDDAQAAKLDLVCRKLDLRPGQRLLDIGCGWGSLLLHAAERYKVNAVGVTLSERQADEANRRAALMGLDHRVRAEVRDYRDLAPLGEFDAVASIGMFEHVGAAKLPEYFRAAYDALTPGGRFLNHGIASAARGAGATPSRDGWRGGLRRATFTERYVFPDGELVPVERAIAVARDATGFEVLDVQSLRPHYALTLRAWVQRLESAWAESVDAAGEEVARTWRLYMAGARVSFERGEIDVAQLLLAKPLGDHEPAPRPLRPWW